MMATSKLSLLALAAAGLLALVAVARADMVDFEQDDMFDDVEFGQDDNFDGLIMRAAAPAPGAKPGQPGKPGQQPADGKQGDGKPGQGDGGKPGQGGDGGDKQCSIGKACTSNGDCGGKDGDNEGPVCSGALVGRCDCTACVAGKQCGDDSACGGLEGACAIGDQPISQAQQRANAAAGPKTGPLPGKCGCLQMAQRKLNETQFPAGQTKPTLAAAINEFCTKVNGPTCSPSACFGLPCHAGFCTKCAPKAKAPAPAVKPAAPAPAKAPAPGAQAAPAPAAAPLATTSERMERKNEKPGVEEDEKYEEKKSEEEARD